MIRNRNGSHKQLDDLMLLRWENEGGCLGAINMPHRGSRSDDYSAAANTTEWDLTPTAIDCALSDDNFVDQLTRRSCRVVREVDWASAT